MATVACSNNNTNNILNEAYFAYLLQAAFLQDPKALTLETLMEMVTQNGHEIVGTKGSGGIAKGSRADLLLWSLKEPAFVPVPYGKFDAALIYNAPDIKPHTVILDGDIVVDAYKFKGLDENEVCRAANRCGARVYHFMNS